MKKEEDGLALAKKKQLPLPQNLTLFASDTRFMDLQNHTPEHLVEAAEAIENGSLSTLVSVAVQQALDAGLAPPTRSKPIKAYRKPASGGKREASEEGAGAEESGRPPKKKSKKKRSK